MCDGVGSAATCPHGSKPESCCMGTWGVGEDEHANHGVCRPSVSPTLSDVLIAIDERHGVLCEGDSVSSPTAFSA